MDERRACSRQTPGRSERAAATIEHVGVAVAVAAMLALAGSGASREGGSLATVIAAATGRALTGESRGGAQRVNYSADAEGERVSTASGGELAAPIDSADLQIAGTAPMSRSWWSRAALDSGTAAGAAWTADASACAVCVGATWQPTITQGVRATASSRDDDLEDAPRAGVGIGASLEGGVVAALAAARGSVTASRDIGAATVSGGASASGVVGAEATGTADIELSTTRQAAQLEGSAVAGAVVRAEERAGIEMFGVAIEQGGAVEGWAGAGARGVIDIGHADGRLEWKVGWGGAVGFGGAGEWSGVIDVSGVDRGHASMAGRALRSGIHAAVPATALMQEAWR